jgi:hypothetical protein
LEFLHQVQDYSQQHHIDGVHIRFVGLFDTVGSFGLHLDPSEYAADNGGFRLTLTQGSYAPAPAHAFHAVALDEERQEFQGIDVVGAFQQGFRGVHSDIGGGYKNKGLSNIALHWMVDNAISSGVPIDSVSQRIGTIEGDFFKNYLVENPNMLPHREIGRSGYTYSPGPRTLPKGIVLPPGYTGPPPLIRHDRTDWVTIPAPETPDYPNGYIRVPRTITTYDYSDTASTSDGE